MVSIMLPVEQRVGLVNSGCVHEDHLRVGQRQDALDERARGLRLGATIAILAPTSAFSSVDLPALGRPRMETNPETKRDLEVVRELWSGMFCLFGFGYANLLDAQIVTGEHFDPNALLLDTLRRPGARGRATR